MFVLNGVSHPRSTSRSYLPRSTLPAVYFRPPPATIRRSSFMSSSCTIVTFFRKPWLDQAAECSSTSRREQAPRKGDGFLTQISAGDDRTESATGNGLRHTPQGCEGRIKSRPAGSCRRVFSEQLLKPQKLESCRRAGTILPPFERLYLVLEG